MNLIRGQYLDDFLNSKDYDIRKTNNARWIDQKCTPDVVTIIADCILEYTSDDKNKDIFSSMDIWHNNYTVVNVEDIFKKPSPKSKAAKNEYDKFFQQPMEMLSYAGILTKIKKGNRNFYSIADKGLLQEIAFGERYALFFLVKYIEKVLRDSGIYSLFEEFFDKQDKNSYEKVKFGFRDFTIEYTPINNETEVFRIFTKVINPLAYDKSSYGTERGRLSKDIITYDMLMYNRDNFRDIYQSKPKGITRKEHETPSPSRARFIQYQMDKAIKNVKRVNQYYNFGLSEVEGDDNPATETHHIFPKTEFPEISYFEENLINLTPNQHRNQAHPLGNFSVVDKEFQKICLIAKLGTIKFSIENNLGVYDFNNFLVVTDTGYRTDIFSQIELYNYEEVIRQINLLK
ncbi:MAG: restriction endonuclease [Bacilli bacterium]|jgi:hypothetical protein|nr:restriction endonuclease [Bacilli bacterium]